MSPTKDDEDDDIDITTTTGIEVEVDARRELDAVLDDLEALLKNGDVVALLTSNAVNASIALLAVQGLRSYLAGNKAQAAEDLGTVAEEVRGRLALSEPPPGMDGSGGGGDGAGG